MADRVSFAVPASVFERRRVPVLVGGPVTGSFEVGGARVVIGPAGTLVIVEAGDAPGRSGVWNAKEVRLIGPAADDVMDRLTGPFHGWNENQWPIHLAVRSDEEILYLGTARLGRAFLSQGVLTRCELRLDMPLATSALDRVRPRLPEAGLPGLEWLGHVGGDRATALELFITGWHPVGVRTSEPLPVSTAALPVGLRRFHRLAEERPEVLGVQNGILPVPVSRPTSFGDMLVFGTENQGCFDWAVRPGDGAEDPVVWFLDPDEEPVAEYEPLSGFLIQFTLFEASMGAEYSAEARSLTAGQTDRLVRPLSPVPLRPFWPWVPTRFFVAPGLVLHVGDGGDGTFSVCAGATHRSALAPLGGHTGVDWAVFDG
ncbi:hypothetical protein ABZ714_19655 [Streptomyces sp. NPDC006798]|uniref:hypothetical protein n=1 Tax=Streptomyces sp. NPDC006798 TaxID=3155462 RepID=UPI003401090E